MSPLSLPVTILVGESLVYIYLSLILTMSVLNRCRFVLCNKRGDLLQ